MITFQEINPSLRPEFIPALRVNHHLKQGFVCEIEEVNSFEPRRIPLTNGLVRITRGRCPIPAENFFQLGPPTIEETGQVLKFVNLTSDVHTVAAEPVSTTSFAVPAIMSIQSLGPKPYKFSNKFKTLDLRGLGSSFELTAFNCAWVLTAEHWIEKSE